METLEEYTQRTRRDFTTVIGRRIPIDGESVAADYYEREVITEESRVTVLVRDLGTLTPYRELGRGNQ